jgi:hypothetical protein
LTVLSNKVVSSPGFYSGEDVPWGEGWVFLVGEQ